MSGYLPRFLVASNRKVTNLKRKWMYYNILGEYQYFLGVMLGYPTPGYPTMP
jgi:hypothetical protein